MRYYAVIDTNVLVSAMLKWDSVPGNILELAFSGVITPVLNDSIVNEYQAVLSRPKFHLPERVIHDILAEIDHCGVYVDAQEVDVDLPDPKDRVFYEVVMEKRNSDDAYLVTGNIRHFPEKPYIVTPRQMLDIILGNEDE